MILNVVVAARIYIECSLFPVFVSPPYFLPYFESEINEKPVMVWKVNQTLVYVIHPCTGVNPF